MKSPEQALVFKGKKVTKSLIKKMERQELIELILENKLYMYTSSMLWVPLIYLRNTLVRDLFKPKKK